ncbi:MAG: Kynureninase (L-kynurenine hydrolase) [Vezdaea aestivalis]|nr:MAG: Kynureninase (L-kynurenine hydrolase) [Vezdaea aestivalis]
MLKVAVPSSNYSTDKEPSIYLCGNSLGLQPRATANFIDHHLRTWATKGVYGHFVHHGDELLDPWLDVDRKPTEQLAKIVGARSSEVAIMGTLTSNLHILMASFYRPTKERYKILIESKAFPSDHFAVESQIQNHNLSTSEAMIQITSPSSNGYISLSTIKSTILAHASSTALLLLPGVQYYTGQFFPIHEITAFAHAQGIKIGWDLAHAVGNVPLELHEWGPDFAVWCSYKYLNAGPGAIAGMFVHERHGVIDSYEDNETPNAVVHSSQTFRKRLCGWWGADKSSRFRMDNNFIPIPGAAGYQLSNPSALDIASLAASLSIFSKTDMATLRSISLPLTTALIDRLSEVPDPPWEIITPLDPSQRGAQISIKLRPGLLDSVMERLKKDGIVVDERKPDVVRVAFVGLWNTIEEVEIFARVWGEAVKGAAEEARQHDTMQDQR